ncbi:hypothetical protein CEXT_744811 [Caerostris extrusa]|uniref:Uncharacterized protein n=1 Tax=Caerostris extrusa TaxID=172846 RepID=A0AAV4Y354_CAEEX|nr:hypothetical protein CEXT_744811 [Caerostris extrusa]
MHKLDRHQTGILPEKLRKGETSKVTREPSGQGRGAIWWIKIGMGMTKITLDSDIFSAYSGGFWVEDIVFEERRAFDSEKRPLR